MAAERTRTRGILNDLREDRYSFPIGEVPSHRGVLPGSLRGYRCPSSRPAGFAGRRGGGILLLLLYFLLLHLLVFRWTRNRPGMVVAGRGAHTEQGRRTSKGGDEKLVKALANGDICVPIFLGILTREGCALPKTWTK